MRRGWMEHAERGFAVTVERRRDLAKGEDELAARARCFRRKTLRVKQRHEDHQDQQFSDLFECCKHKYPLQVIVRTVSVLQAKIWDSPLECQEKLILTYERPFS